MKQLLRLLRKLNFVSRRLVDRMTADGRSDEEVKAFKTKMQKWVAGLLSKDRFKNLMFYQGFLKFLFTFFAAAFSKLESFQVPATMRLKDNYVFWNFATKNLSLC